MAAFNVYEITGFRMRFSRVATPHVQTQLPHTENGHNCNIKYAHTHANTNISQPSSTCGILNRIRLLNVTLFIASSLHGSSALLYSPHHCWLYLYIVYMCVWWCLMYMGAYIQMLDKWVQQTAVHTFKHWRDCPPTPTTRVKWSWYATSVTHVTIYLCCDKHIHSI